MQVGAEGFVDGLAVIADLANVVAEAAGESMDRETLRALASKAIEKHRATLAVCAGIAAKLKEQEQVVPERPPGYWMNELSGKLRPVVEKYLRGERLDGMECATMRAYCRQWITAQGFSGPEVDELRRTLHTLTNHDAVLGWMEKAEAAMVDPL